jgi:hypothetical protein
MNSINVDQWLREKAPQQSSVLPSIVSQRIEETLHTLPTVSKIRRNHILRRLMWTAVSLLVFTGVLLAAVWFSPKMSMELQQVPVMGAAIQSVSELRHWSATDQGITVTVDKVRDDGLMLSADISIRSSGKMKSAMMDYLLRMDDDLITANAFENSFRDNGNGVYHATIKQYIMSNHPETYLMSLYVTQVGATRGKWFFTIPVTKSAKDLITIKPDAAASSEDMDFAVTEITFAPSSTQMLVQFSKTPRTDLVHGFEMIDDAGVVTYSYGPMKNQDSTGQSTQAYLLGPVTQGTRSVLVRPFSYKAKYFPSDNQLSHVALNRTPTAKDPIIVPQGGEERLLVTGVQFMEDKTWVNIRPETSSPLDAMSRLFIVDDKGKTYYSAGTPIIRLGQKEYTLEFPAVSPKLEFRSYPVLPLTFYPELEMRFDLPR